MKKYIRKKFIEEVDNFIYLGSYIDLEKDTKKLKLEMQGQQWPLETLKKYGNNKY